MDARSLLSRHWRTLAGAGLGAAAGAAYAFFIGCNTGTCPLTSNVWTAALFFGFAGGLVGVPGPGPRDERGGEPRPEPDGSRPSR